MQRNIADVANETRTVALLGGGNFRYLNFRQKWCGKQRVSLPGSSRCPYKVRRHDLYKILLLLEKRMICGQYL